jgi:hypothetical protein
VRLELIDEPLVPDGVLVVELFWRDPSAPPD